MKKKAKKLSQSQRQRQRQRLQFIESRLIWEGSVQRREICEAFDLTLNHVTREITSYRKQFKDNLVYDPETRAWRAGPAFKPAYASGEPEEYLTLLHAYALSGERAVMVTVGPTVPAQALPQVSGKIERAILKDVISAIRRGTGLVVRYQSFSDPEPVDRTLWPHAMAYINDRWHVRAYDSRREKFGDFVLARIIKARPADATDTPPPASADEGWQTVITLAIIPTPTMSASQKTVVAREFGMRRAGESWLWKVLLRRSLAPYFLHQHRLDMPTSAAPHRRIALHDPAVAKLYAFVDD